MLSLLRRSCNNWSFVIGLGLEWSSFDLIISAEDEVTAAWSELFKLPKPEEVSELPEFERCKLSRFISMVRIFEPWLESWPLVIFELLELLRMCFLLNSVPRTSKKSMRKGSKESWAWHLNGGVKRSGTKKSPTFTWPRWHSLFAKANYSSYNKTPLSQNLLCLTRKF